MKKKYLIYFITILLSFSAGMFVSLWQKNTNEISEVKNKVLYWKAPMDPNYRRDKPGKSPMGMDLVPVYENDSIKGADSGIKISPNIEHNLGVRTAEVQRMDMSRVIDTVGLIAVNENQVEQTHVYTEGWIEELFVQSEGEPVKKGQILFKVYSPKIVNAQEEYILALKSDSSALKQAAIKKLGALGFNEKQFAVLEEKKKASKFLNVYSDQDGLISQLNVKEGMYVNPNKALIIVEDLSKVWLVADVYESQSNWIKLGQKAEIKSSNFPGKVWTGDVDYISSSLDPKSQTLQVRVLFQNESDRLKLNMFVDVKIHADMQKNILAIPREAVIYTGSETRVVIKLKDGKYLTRLVSIGMESGEMVQVLEGLKEGELIVTSAQFLIDSESSLSASFNRLEEKKESTSSPVDHMH